MNQTQLTTSRFSLVLLEPDEIYFEDYLIYYYQTNIDNDKAQKGMLKICSKSIVFEAFDIKLPIIKFQYKYIDSDFINNSDYLNNTDIKNTSKYFSIKTKQIIQLKENNDIKPYQIQRFNEFKTFYFQLIFTQVNDSLHLMKQLYRANTLDYEHEELMVNSIVKSFIIRIKFDLTQLVDVYNEQILFECEIYKINALVKNPGKLFLTNKFVYYKSINNLENFEKFLKIKLDSVKNVFKRRFKLRKNIACEILLDSSLDKNNSYLYLLFENELKCEEFYEKIRNLIKFNEDLSEKHMLQKWRYGVISNYDYLLYLNTLADRSFNDLTQYPIIPWVLTDYKSKTIDLNDESIYRDLNKPIGALNETRLNRLKSRYNELKNEKHKWLYGSHYSTPAFVLYYLIRQYPELQLCLQNGRFDQPDRIFHSIDDTWLNCLTFDTDFKELIPQFYDTSVVEECGSFLCNSKALNFGQRQDGEYVNNVILPNWCEPNNVKQFIHTLRDALESTHVSNNIHKWIDLIFGYKQCGQQALDADNLFYYLCYEGAIDLDSIKDVNERKSIEIQILEFGQIPIQLFKQAHPTKAKLNPLTDTKRISFDNIENLSNELIDTLNFSSISKIGENKNVNETKQKQHDVQIRKIIKTKIHKDAINELCIVKQNDVILICSVSNDNYLKIFSIEQNNDLNQHRSLNICSFSISSIDYIKLNEDNFLFLLASWDNSIYVYDINYSRCIYTQHNAHDDAVTCIRVLQTFDKSTQNQQSYDILTSSWDSTVKLWNLSINHVNDDTSTIANIKFQYANELQHDIGINKFCLNSTNKYLTSICMDKNLYVWSKSDNDNEESYNFLYSIKSNCISDCKLIDFENEIALLYCTSNFCIKLQNILTKSILFEYSLNSDVPTIKQDIKLTSILYSNNYLIISDSVGYLYFLNIKNVKLEKKMCLNDDVEEVRSLECLVLFQDNYLCIGDDKGYLYALNLE